MSNAYSDRKLSAHYPTDLVAWKKLAQHYQSAMRDRHLRDLFSRDKKRAANFGLQAGDLFLDYSRNHLNNTTLKLLSQLATQADVPEAIDELQRVAKMGIRGVAIPCTAPPDKLYSDPAYEPFWSAAEEAGLPITMHIFCGSTWPMNLPSHWDPIVSYTLSHAAIWETVSNLIT